MTRITVDEWSHIPAGTKVASGYSNGYCTAPQEEGLYTLYELVHEDSNTHAGWEWEKEVSA